MPLRTLVLVLVLVALAGPAAANGAPGLRMISGTLDVAGTLGVPLTNGTGMALADVPVTVHTEDARLYVTRWQPAPATFLVATGVGGMTVAARGTIVLIVYVDLAASSMAGILSLDGGRTFGAAVALGARPAGPALPAACLYASGAGLRAVAVWSAQPSESDGPLVIALHDGQAWRPAAAHSTIRSSGAALHCADNQLPEVVWRDHREQQAGRISLYQASIEASGGLSGEHRIVAVGYDPSYCGAGDMRLVGYHGAINEAHIVRSLDRGVTFSEVDMEPAAAGVQGVDDSGKFVSIACDGALAIATWGDWPTKQEAAARAPSRMLGAAISIDGGATWTAVRPGGEDQSQGPATVAARGNTAFLMWKSGGQLRVAAIIVE